MANLYAPRDPRELDRAGSYFTRHMDAMTGEGLHSKGDIARELGHRAMLLDRMDAMLTLAITYLTSCPWAVCPNPTEKPCGECWWKYLEAEATAPGDS